MDDELELLRAWRDGDQARGNELVRRHFRSVHRFFRNKVDGEIDDLIQRTFLGCVEALDRFRELSSFKTFLLSIARNQLFLYYRSRAQGKARDVRDLSIRELVGEGSPTKALALRDEQRALLAALRQLPLDQQITVELFYWERLGVNDIAAVLDVAAGTIKSRLKRARDALRRSISEMDVPEDLRTRTIDGLDRWARSLREKIGEIPEPT